MPVTRIALAFDYMDSASNCTIPYANIDTVFLDVGDTLISMDFDSIAAELSARGVASDAATVRRAEAAARPRYSRRMFIEGMPAGTNVFRALLTEMVGGLPAAARLARAAFDALISELRQALRPDGRASVLWRSVMTQVPEALARMQALGLQLVAVSNSDGTAEQSLVDAGMRPYLNASSIRRLPATRSPTRGFSTQSAAALGSDRGRVPCTSAIWTTPT